jgi:ribosome assembly protein YihI (activator of Der GTPase)
MPRQKKSRKVGKIGITKTEAPRKPKRAPSVKNKTTSGNKSGSRQQVAMDNSNNKGSQQKGDPRIGSKKAINLSKYKEQSTTNGIKQQYQSPQQELDAIEQDLKLEKLLAKKEDKRLSANEKDYLESTLKRHKELCEILGIRIESDETEETVTEIDPFTQLDAIRLDDYKD